MKQCPNCERATMLGGECVHCDWIEPPKTSGVALFSGVFVLIALGCLLFVTLQEQKVVPPANQAVIVPPVVIEPEPVQIGIEEAKLREAIRIAMSDKTADEIMQLHLLPEPELSKPVSFMSADGYYMEVTPEGVIVKRDFE